MTLLKQLTHRRVSIIFTCLVLMAASPVLAQVSAFEDPSSGAAGATAGGTEFSPAKAEIDGSDIAQGQLSQVIVMMRNNSALPITLQKINLVPSSNVTATVVGNQCDKEPVKPGIECPVTISVKGESSGKYRVGLLINHTGRSGVTNLAIIGNVSGGGGSAGGLPSNEIESYPPVVDFAAAKGRTPLVRSVVLRNTSTATIKITDITLAASPLTGFAVSAPDCKELQPSGSCVATVTWTPTTEGKAEGAIMMRHDGPSGNFQISLLGEYTPPKTEKAERFPSAVAGRGLIVADRDGVEFGSDIDGAASITVSLVNAGDKPVTLKQVRLAGSDNGLSLSTDDCSSGKVLEAQQGCALTVNWLPRRKGPVIDDIQVIHDGARGVLVLPVRGTATEVVSMNMPILGSSSLPKLPTSDLDEKVLGSDKAPKVDQAQVGGKPKNNTTASAPQSMMRGGEYALATDPSALNGYRVTSLSADRAVITGTNGRIVVHDGTPQVIAGSHWIPRVMSEGVELIGERDSVVLLFDRALGAITANVSAGAFSSGAGVAVGIPAAPSSSAIEGGTKTP